MEDQTNVLILLVGCITTAIGLFLTVKSIVVIAANTLIAGELYDRRSCGHDHYLPVISYSADGTTHEYVSSHYSILQRIGQKITLVYNTRDGRVLGTMGELFFKPIVLMLAGISITAVMALYFAQ